MFELTIRVAGEIANRLDFDREAVRIGRDQSMEVWLPDPTLSKHHATILRDGSAYVLRDEGSTNGTFVNDARLAARPLNDGDRIRAGGYELVFAHRLPAWMRVATERAERVATDGVLPTYALEPGRERAIRERTANAIAELVPEEGPPVVLDRDVLYVGRDEGCAVRLKDARAPRLAALVLRGQSGWQLVPTGGLVSIGEQRLSDRAWLADGDRVAVHDLAFVFRVRARA